jgi:hypothetical protein
MRSLNYEVDPAFANKRYMVKGWKGVAFYVLGWQTEPDEDTEWSGMENPTGNLLAVMVGDDYKHVVDLDDLTELNELDYCGECGQIGCTHDGKDRSALDNR